MTGATAVDAARPRRARGAEVPLWTTALALGVVVLAGGLCLAMPFWGDQALFTVYARQLTHGAVLYRDVFDIKQPGIFLFYATGGQLFGYDEVGIHLFELLYWVAFSAFAVPALRPYFTRWWSAPLVPILTVAVYYVYAGLLDLTQVEIVMAFPLLAAWWLIDRADPATRQGLRRYAAAGLLAAAVVLLKHLYLLILLGFIAYAVRRSYRQGVARTEIGRALAAWLVALAVPLLVTGGYFAAYGQLPRIWWGYFEMSVSAHLTTPRPLIYLLLGARRFLIGHAPILILATIGCIHGLRQRSRQKDLVVAMLLWSALGGFAFIALQGWPEYKWPLFTVPFGILAAVGIEALAAALEGFSPNARRGLFAAAAAIAVLVFIAAGSAPHVQTRLLVVVAAGMCAGLGTRLLPPRTRRFRVLMSALAAALGVAAGLAAIGPARKLHVLADHGFALSREARTRFQWSWNRSYLNADEDLAVLRRRDSQPGAFFVFGDPVLMVRAGTPQPIAIFGWGPEFLDATGWQELHRELAATLPRYIVIDTFIEAFIRNRYPPVMSLVDSRYEVAFVGASGTWYVLR